MRWVLSILAALGYLAILIFIWSLCRAAKRGDETMHAAWNRIREEKR